MIRSSGHRRAARGAATIAKLLNATATILSADGAAGVSVQRIADVAGTSKGLVHYHFPGKDALLAACAEQLTAQLVDAESTALIGSSSQAALDNLWGTFSKSEQSGARRALLALAVDATSATRSALAASAVRRRHAAAQNIAQLEHLLGFTPRVPRATLAAAYVALTDGLALDLRVRPDVDSRPAFDAFWLAVLSLGAE